MSTKRLTRRQQRQQTQEMENILNKKFSMKRISPMTKNQGELMNQYHLGMNIAAIGSAGTGKTYVSLALALEDVMINEAYNQIIILRSAVQSRDQGFMPGSLQEKMSYYETPYIDIVNDLFGRPDAYNIMKQKGMINFMSTSFVRGLTFDNSVIIVDEVQNMNVGELRTIMTRVGENSRIIFCGDTKQDDLVHTGKYKFDSSGLPYFKKIIDRMSSHFTTINFTVDDIVRSKLVKEFIISEERVLEELGV